MWTIDIGFQMVNYITANRSRDWLIWIGSFQPITISDSGSEIESRFQISYNTHTSRLCVKDFEINKQYEIS